MGSSITLSATFFALREGIVFGFRTIADWIAAQSFHFEYTQKQPILAATSQIRANEIAWTLWSLLFRQKTN